MRARTGIDPWFLRELRQLDEAFEGVRTYKAVDTCAAEFEAETPYYYSAWERNAAERGPARRQAERDDPRLRPEPDRPGHRVRLLLRARRDDRARVRPRRGDGQLQPGDRLDRLRHERPPVLRAADARGRARDRRDRAARGRDRLLRRPDAAAARRGPGGRRRAAARHPARGDRPRRGPRPLRRAARAARTSRRRRTRSPTARRRRWRPRPSVGFPLLVRPSYVLGGRAMELVYDEEMLADYFARTKPQGEIFLDRFLENAIEVDVDAICDGEDVWIGGIMQHVEEAGIHSGDSRLRAAAAHLGTEMLRRDPQATTRPRARARRGRPDQHPVRRLRRRPVRHRGQPARVADRPVRLQGDGPAAGQARLPRDARREARDAWACPRRPSGNHVSVKEAVLPFDRFAGADALLGPEMRSTGEVMGVAADFPTAFAKAQAAVGTQLPTGGTVFLTVTDSDKAGVRRHRRPSCTTSASGSSPPAARASAIKRMGIPVETINKIQDGSPHVRDWIDRGDVDLVINTPTGTAARSDGYEIRRAAVARGIPCITTIAGGMAAARAIGAAASATRRWSRCRSCTRTGPCLIGQMSTVARRMVTYGLAESGTVPHRPAACGRGSGRGRSRSFEGCDSAGRESPGRFLRARRRVQEKSCKRRLPVNPPPAG